MAHPTLEYIRGLRKTMETKKAEIVGENENHVRKRPRLFLFATGSGRQGSSGHQDIFSFHRDKNSEKNLNNVIFAVTQPISVR